MTKKPRTRKANASNQCPAYPIEITDKREIVMCDRKRYAYRPDRKGYFLVAIDREAGLICCGFVKRKRNKHIMVLELRARDPDSIIKEIAKRKLCSLASMGYVASELMIARDALENRKKYIQR